jgi:neopullulanase
MTFPGAPSIYYGDEIGMAGGHDPDNRRAFRWDRPESWDTDLLHDFQKMVALRNERPALRRGSFTFLYARGDASVFLRQFGEESIIVAFNTGRQTARIDIPASPHLTEGTGLDEVWTHETIRVESGSLHRVDLAPRSGRVFATPAVSR